MNIYHEFVELMDSLDAVNFTIADLENSTHPLEIAAFEGALQLKTDIENRIETIKPQLPVEWANMVIRSYGYITPIRFF